MLVALVAAESARTGAAMNCWSRNWLGPDKLRRPACCYCRETRTDNLINKETRASVCRHKLQRLIVKLIGCLLIQFGELIREPAYLDTGGVIQTGPGKIDGCLCIRGKQLHGGIKQPFGC